MNEKETDEALAKKYISKIATAKQRKIEFLLSFSQYKRLMTREKCGYCGVTMRSSTEGKQGFYTRTIDRIDSSLGYVKGNVITVCFGANQLKSIWENPNTPLTKKMVSDIIRKSSNR